MSFLKKRVLHRWPEDRQHLRVVVSVLNNIRGIDDGIRFKVCERYVVSETIVTGRKILKLEGRKALECLIESFVEEVSDSIQSKLTPFQDETGFFLGRWFRSVQRRLQQ